MKISVFGSMGMFNVGDEAYVEASMNEIRKKYPHADFSMISFDDDDSRKVHKVDDAALMPRMNKTLTPKNKWHRRFITLSQGLQYLMVFVFGTAFFCPDSQVRKVIRLMREADVVAAFGGGLVNDNYSGTALVYLVLLALAQRLGKRTVFMAQSFGPVSRPINVWLSKKVLPKTDLVSVREKQSIGFLEDIGISSENVVLTICPAFLLSATPANAIYEKWDIDTNKRLIGMAVRKWHYPGEQDPVKAYERYINMMTEAADKIAESLDATIVIVPTIPEDIELGNDIMQRSKDPDRIRMPAQLYTPSEIVGIESKLDMMVTTNFHPLIFATCQGVPSVILTLTGHKIPGFAELAGLSDYIIDQDDVSTETIVNMANRLWSELDEVKAHLNTTIPVLKELAMNSIDRLNNDVLDKLTTSHIEPELNLQSGH